MKCEKEKIYTRIRNLEDWQKHMIIGDYLFYADEKELKSIEQEVDAYERINKETKK